MGAGILVSAIPSTSAASDVAGQVVEAVRAAIDGWSQFTATGDLAAASSHFVVDGPQWQQFEAESAAWGDSTGSEPLQLEILENHIRRLESATATVWVKVRASRTGYESEVFGWDFDLIDRDGEWRVWTVVPADEPTAPVETQPAGARATTTIAPPGQVFDPEPRGFEEGTAAAAAASGKGTRLPALSAWIVVVTLVGVAVAGYMAPRIDRRGEG